jgi:hypothetical protein
VLIVFGPTSATKLRSDTPGLSKNAREIYWLLQRAYSRISRTASTGVCQEKKFEEPGEIELRRELTLALIKARNIHDGPFREIVEDYSLNMVPDRVKKEEH